VKASFVTALLLPFLLLTTLTASESPPADALPTTGPPVSPGSNGKPVVEPAEQSEEEKPEGVQWKPLLVQSLKFLVVENIFRYATEDATRHPGLPYFQGYVDSIANLHGWADGDPFYVNYVGHPMQGAVAGFVWVQNDTRYRGVEFGRDRNYWKSRLRATAYSWAYSMQTEIGPLLSEAAIGNIQARYPQVGFVDQVITPTIGLGWQVTEDVMDRYLVRFLERKTGNRYYRAMFRSGLNPTRSLANVIGGRWPWTRPRDKGEEFLSASRPDSPEASAVEAPPGVAPFEAAFNSYFLHGANGPCIGGGSTVGFRIHPEWQIVAEVNGCAMTGLETNLTGDSLIYAAGLRWTPILRGRWHPFIQFLGGGSKVTQELNAPQQKASLDRKARATDSPPPDHFEYARETDTAGSAVVAGTGLDYQLNRALALRVIGVDYTHAWVREMPGFGALSGFQVKAGFVVRMGTW